MFAKYNHRVKQQRNHFQEVRRSIWSQQCHYFSPLANVFLSLNFSNHHFIIRPPVTDSSFIYVFYNKSQPRQAVIIDWLFLAYPAVQEILQNRRWTCVRQKKISTFYQNNQLVAEVKMPYLQPESVFSKNRPKAIWCT